MVRLLALVYRSVDWGKQGGSSVLDRWAGMVLVASRANTVGGVVNDLCQRLGVGIPRETERGEIEALLASCQPHEGALLDWLDEETIPVATMAYGEAREMRNG